MRKKLQVYISSTYADLVEERHAAVEAVLEAGHIPAGVGLFFKETQMGIIKRSIDESDVYILILGGFYGLTLRDDESKSYTHWEYDYAGEVGKPRFAFVVTDEALEQKPYDFELGGYYQKLQEFKRSVLEEIPTFYVEDVQHIQLVIHDQLQEYAGRDDLCGWFSGKDVPDVQKLWEENASLLRENAKLNAELEENKKTSE
ncbi:DUF4062 domain-containing protein [Paenibacillus azoreducens]|uniref:DUF4062 domain-containing protein n=1 Tax=Paenibacillus azoreducens TaxID=116718 RepID=A0A919YHJ5_9BACL|nr:DUF4062 domain-containing protein [Paenibacillus azoreducens]GIO48810.1 hypothetical protein J34TS1_35750 [Paenibacillus azoreducens]